ncbi:unnamed protein product [Linum trigynum]|uniref:Uncharacterized protein n=1 Tax=Linum trigynum TaxID=586398 RepID=A0AAV2GPE0_9ROSI
MWQQVLASGGGGSTMGEAMAVVKKSTNPKEEFKRSTMEMIAQSPVGTIARKERDGAEMGWVIRDLGLKWVKVGLNGF